LKSAAAEEAFRSELERAVELIREHPETWPTYVHGTRRFVMRRFPYSIVYPHGRDDIPDRRRCPREAEAGLLEVAGEMNRA